MSGKESAKNDVDIKNEGISHSTVTTNVYQNQPQEQKHTPNNNHLPLVVIFGGLIVFALSIVGIIALSKQPTETNPVNNNANLTANVQTNTGNTSSALEDSEYFDYWTYQKDVPEKSAKVFRQKFDNLRECQQYQKGENPKYLITIDKCEDETPDYDRLKQMCESGDNLACKMKEFLETGTNQIKDESKITGQNESEPVTNKIVSSKVVTQPKVTAIPKKVVVIQKEVKPKPDATPSDCSDLPNGCPKVKK
jgi:hypothetical protein